MAIINLTPDSFSDGGEIRTPEELKERVERLLRSGAELLDVGAESTRPGAAPVPPRIQLQRLKPFFQLLPTIPVPVSVDTRSSLVAEAALKEGVEIINDVSGGRHDPLLPEVVARYGAVALVMHMRGEPRTMDHLAVYRDLFREIEEEWLEAKERFLRAGVREEQIWFDPGIGFAKTPEQSLAILKGIERFCRERIVVVGHSRKRVMGWVSGEPDPRKRDPVTAYFSFLLALKGVAVLRVHNPALSAPLLRLASFLRWLFPLFFLIPFPSR